MDLVRDTVVEDSIVYFYPTYATEWSDEWSKGEITASKDSIFRSVQMRNEYEVTIGKKKNGLFKDREHEVTVTNLNPNTYTDELRTFTVKEKPKNIGIGLQIGYGVSSGGIAPMPYLGVGVSYNLIRL